MKTTLFALLFAASLWGYGEDLVYWAPKIPNNPHPGMNKHAGHGMGEKTAFTAVNADTNSSVQLFLPDLSVKSLELKHNALHLPKPTVGGYYALVVHHSSPERVDTALRYLSLNARPVKISPTKLVTLPKASLEIIPHPLHREHDRYTASKTYRFILAFREKPLSLTPATLETGNGTSKTYTSDEQGVLTVSLPNDFKNVSIRKGENKPSEFLLNVRHNEKGIMHVTTLTMPYYPNPNDYWQSQSLGAGAIAIGFLGGLLVYRRIKSKGAKRG